MADLKKLMELLGQSQPSFNMTAPENLTQPEEQIDPADLEPAVEGDDEDYQREPANITPAAAKFFPPKLATDQEIAKIQSLPLPEGQKSIPATKADATPEQLPQTLTTPDDDPMSRRKNLLEELQKQRSNTQLSAGMLQAGNQIAQAMAAGYGAKIGDGSDAVKMIQGMAGQPIKDYAEQIANEENDPKSDVSKFMRENAYSTLSKLYPGKKYDLENMTASQLKKVFGNKLLGGSNAPMEWIATDRVTTDGTPVKFNRRTGEFMAGNRIIQPGESTPRDIARKDELTGQYGLAGPGGALMVKPTDYSSVDKKLTTKSTDEFTGESKEQNVKFSDFMKAAPKVSDSVLKLKEQFIKDMQNSREVAAASTMLSSKLTPGADNQIDSGLLGGIQTQAAKMAGQKGVLTDQDLNKFAGAGGAMPKIKRIIDGTFFGEMTDDDIKFFKRFSQLMNSSLNKIVENDSQYYVDQVKQIGEGFAPGFTDKNAREWLAVDKVAPSVQGKNSTSNEDKVKVELPDGRIGFIPKANLQKAISKGAKEIK